MDPNSIAMESVVVQTNDLHLEMDDNVRGAVELDANYYLDN